MIKSPMLSAKERDIDKLLAGITYPKLVSPKMDGFRAFGHEGSLYTRHLKLVRNKATQKRFGVPELHGLDAELIVGNPWDFNLMQQTSSGVTTIEGDPASRLFVFDDFSCRGGFAARLQCAQDRIIGLNRPDIVFVRHELVRNQAELLAYEQKCLDRGYEGIMARDPTGPYKEGRSTMKENYLVAVKRRESFECRVLDVHEGETNLNEATINELGHTQRSSHKANKVLRGTFGGFTLQRLDDGVTFRCGSGPGVDTATRADWWARREELKGSNDWFVTISAITIGVKNKPRLPLIMAMRHITDMPAGFKP